MTVYTVYDLGMAKHVYVQIRGVEKAVYIEADKVQVDKGSGITILTRGSEQVAEFERGAVVGWWIQEPKN
jgi:hypothetical protein